MLSVLKRMKNVFITPHIAGSESMEKERLGEYMYKSYQDLLSNNQSSCEVTLDMINGMA
jgi:phosphoglycerate dehydrogenase-like enzyme